jgi:hypothetical protein
MQPAEILAALKQSFADVEMKPFLQVVREEHEAEGSTASAEERRFYQPFTEVNAYVIRSKKGGVDVSIFSSQLCTAIGGLSKPPSPNPSVERTSLRPLRGPKAAAHVERWAPANER